MVPKINFSSMVPLSKFPEPCVCVLSVTVPLPTSLQEKEISYVFPLPSAPLRCALILQGILLPLTWTVLRDISISPHVVTCPSPAISLMEGFQEMSRSRLMDLATSSFRIPAIIPPSSSLATSPIPHSSKTLPSALIIPPIMSVILPVLPLTVTQR